jgi:glycosyltransferase involved in cell wall biosynthesis
LEEIKDILFITPTLHRTGSELVLFHLINRLDKKFKPSVLSIERGSLYNSLASTIEKNYLVKDKSTGILRRIYKKFAFEKQLASKLAKHKDQIWYVNTIVLPYVLKYAEKYHAKVIIHTHELDHIFNLFDNESKALLISAPQLVIANSNKSADVMRKHGYKGNLEVCYPFIDTKKYKFDKAKYDSVRSQLNVSHKNFVWLMCGTMDENKNPDLFIQLAEQFKTLKPESKFIWLGDNIDDPAYKKICLEKSRHLNNLIWIHEKGEAYINYMNCCDGFILTSNVESFSLVTLEAMALGKPVVVNNCGGVSEIINSKEIGTIIETKNDVQQFVSAMTTIMDKKVIVDTEKAIERTKTFDVSISAALWNAILTQYFGS